MPCLAVRTAVLRDCILLFINPVHGTTTFNIRIAFVLQARLSLLGVLLLCRSAPKSVSDIAIFPLPVIHYLLLPQAKSHLPGTYDGNTRQPPSGGRRRISLLVNTVQPPWICGMYTRIVQVHLLQHNKNRWWLSWSCFYVSICSTLDARVHQVPIVPLERCSPEYSSEPIDNYLSSLLYSL